MKNRCTVTPEWEGQPRPTSSLSHKVAYILHPPGVQSHSYLSLHEKEPYGHHVTTVCINIDGLSY